MQPDAGPADSPPGSSAPWSPAPRRNWAARFIRGKESDAAWKELKPVIDEELSRLPEKYREPFVLCSLENLGCADAARRLGVAEGTIWSRLAEARQRLRKRR